MPAAALWICCCAYLICAGWILSALNELNTAGYAVALLAGAGSLAIWPGKTGGRLLMGFRRPKGRRRFKKILPLAFLTVAVLELAGGILYAPCNYDALTYRLPRMLNWLAAGHWLWIPTINERMNYSGTAWEWTAMPFFALARSDRGMFLINALGFFLMPGLLFSIFRRLGVAGKTAWTWMWILPLAYGFTTQAGGIGNDLTGALFCLASIYFGLLARHSARVQPVWLSVLAAALMTGDKVSNLPLLLPWLIAVWPALPRLWTFWRSSLVIGLAALLVSAAPIMLLNQKYAGSWTGDPNDKYKMEIKNPVAGILGNACLLTEASLEPPLLPGAQKIDPLMSGAVPAWLNSRFPRLKAVHLNEIPGEEGAALGLGVTLPLFIAAVFALCRGGSVINFLRRLSPVTLAGYAAALFFMAKMGSEAGPRLMLPYYALVLVPLLQLSAHNTLLKWRGWRIFLALCAWSTLAVVVPSISRPLWPAQTMSSSLAQAHPENKMLQRLASAYTAYAHRNDFLAPIRAGLPENATVVGFVAGSNDTDYSLWHPIGRRTVVYPQYHIESFLKNPDVEWLVVKEDAWPNISREPLADWAQEHGAKSILTVSVVELVSWGPEKWTLFHIEKP
jgi:hypothetical protein